MSAIAYHLEPLRGLAGLTTAPQAVPEPGPRQVVIRVKAVSFNRRDLMLIDGTYPLSAAPGVVPIADGVGDVVAVGADVTRAEIGDRVAPTYFTSYVDGPQRLVHVADQYGAIRDGLLATYAVLEEDSVVHVPEFLTDAEAASLNCAGVTAWHALTRPVRTAAGDQVLVVGSGSVALFGVQFAKALGARVIAVTSSEEKAARLRALGAAEVVDRTVTPDWEAAVLELTGGDGVAQVLDAVGPATLPKSLAAAAYNAQITMVGAFPADSVEPDADPLRGAFASVRRIAVGSRADFEAMNAFLTEHRIRPAVDRVFPVSEAVDAYRYFRDAGPFGKVVIELPS